MMLKHYNINDRQRINYHCVIKLLSPLSHIGESIGNQSNLRTTSVVDFYNQSQEIFAYSGNAIRNGIIRRLGVDSFLEILDVKVQQAAHQTLFAGGYIDASTACDLELDAKIRKFLPPISVLGTAKPKNIFGGGATSQMIPGRINIGDALIVCLESAENIYRRFPCVIPISAINSLKKIVDTKDEIESMRVKNWLEQKTNVFDPDNLTKILAEEIPFLEAALPSYNQWLTWGQKIRQDSLKQPELAKHLNRTNEITLPGQQSLLGTTEVKQAESKVVQQMIMGDWLLQTGATLYSFWSGFLTRIEMGFIADALTRWADSPYLGGKRGAGCGMVEFKIYYTLGKESGLYFSSAGCVSKKMSQDKLVYHEYLSEYKHYLSDLNQLEIKELLNE